MPEFRVIWEIDVDAPDAEQAARKAWAIMRYETSTANCFDVVKKGATETVRIDLHNDQEKN